ncbi:hypothetical protein LIER_31381 [Lithospermum erythrorhizon]|uniref:Retrovirus-related Pol polyprotein from transposon TNT 1-94-like beta-barrel domain-containing protein n=1 Tax=Lithospermum erythrorhizon TaxID=34254 RepID=A0AAV3RWQ5_LITER
MEHGVISKQVWSAPLRYPEASNRVRFFQAKDQITLGETKRGRAESPRPNSMEVVRSNPDKTQSRTQELPRSKGEFGEAKRENSGVSKIVATGEVHLKSKLGKVIVLSNVRHIPYFWLSLISSRKLDDEGYINTFGNG